MNDQDDQSERDLLDESSLGLHVELLPGKSLSQVEEPPAVEEADWPHFRRLTFFSVLAGLCPLIPLPSEDDRVTGLIHRQMVRELGESRSLDLSEDEARLLAGSTERRSLALTVRRGIGRIVGKVLRRPSSDLLLREGVDRTVETFGEGYLLLHAASLPQALRPAGRTEERVRAVRTAVTSTLRDSDVSSIRKAVGSSFQRSFDLLSRAAAKLGAQGVSLDEEGELLDGFVDQLAGALWGDHGCCESLERSFGERLARLRPVQ
ncbi:MAG TPA: hypothetical protein VEW48_08100 [Thermoanaerobaculia bacterium]|nr:hypothetical protein [Thermoanaerobaculia bacterium]